MPNPEEREKLSRLKDLLEREDRDEDRFWGNPLITTEGLERRDKFNGSDIETEDEDE